MADVYPRASGHPNYSSAGTTQFIPEIWSSKMLVKFYKSTVFAAISNTDYENEIKNMGDKVIIRTVPDINIKNYKKGQTLQYETPESPSIELPIDQGKWWGLGCDDVDKTQADIPFMNKFTDDAGEQMKITVDNEILNWADAFAHEDNIGLTAGAESGSYVLGTSGTAVQLDSTNVVDKLVDCNSCLSEQNVPESGRWAVIPEWMANLIKKSELKDASLSGDGTSMLRNGRLGMIDRLTLYVTNNYDAISDSGSKYAVLFGHPSAITFASQLTKVETLRNPFGFGDIVRGLNIYGRKVIKPESLGVLYCYK